MPIQITELNIAVSVSTPPTSSNVTLSEAPQKASGETKNLVNECVDQVVKIIRDKKER